MADEGERIEGWKGEESKGQGTATTLLMHCIQKASATEHRQKTQLTAGTQRKCAIINRTGKKHM